MQFFKYALVFSIIFALLDPTEGGWFRKAVRKAKKSVKKVIKKAGKAIKKVGCKFIFGVACPATATAAGVAVSAYTSGMGDALVGMGVAAAKNACHVRKSKCKRSVPTGYIMYPFSDNFYDYDMNGDKDITYEEFTYTMMTSYNLANPEELMEPFIFADLDGNEKLDTQEFQGAPFLFGHFDYLSGYGEPDTNPVA